DFEQETVEPIGDWIGVLSVALPVTATTPRSSTSFTFTPTRYQYASKEYSGPASSFDGANLSDLSFTDYTANLSWNFTQSPRTGWTATASAGRSERPGVTYDNVRQDLFLLPPTVTTSWSATGTGTFRFSERAAWIVGLGSTGTRYQSNRFVGSEGQPIRVDNSMTTSLGLASETRLTPLSQLRIGYVGQYIDNGGLGSDLVQNLGGAYLYGDASQGWQFTGRVGVAWLKTANLPVQDTLPGEPPPQRVDEFRPVFLISASRQIVRRTTVEAGIEQQFTGSNGVEGTALTFAAYTALRAPIRQYSRFGLALRYSDRDPVQEGFATSRTMGASAEYVAGLSRHWGLGFGVQFYNQRTGDTAGTADFVPDGNYALYSAVVSWNPTAR
ncbi:MAG: hypothetical protein MUE47_07010, partial [Acidobacteria bacterium]|nr:hypothetical protein [Acidobacteriota bacterium]